MAEKLGDLGRALMTQTVWHDSLRYLLEAHNGNFPPLVGDVIDNVIYARHNVRVKAREADLTPRCNYYISTQCKSK
jgi:hypothetical protein